MSLTDSTMMPLGTAAPAFELPDTVSGRRYRFDDVAGERGTVVMFICNHCPYVLHIVDAIAALAAEYRPRGVGFVAISANDVDERPEDGPEHMKRLAQAKRFVFPYLYDESQAVARAYNAVCTPDFFVFDAQARCVYRGQFDAQARCVYRGQFDAARPGRDAPVTSADLRAALDAVLAGETIPEEAQTPSQGCSIKWKTATGASQQGVSPAGDGSGRDA